jgi:hypothetical protein
MSPLPGLKKKMIVELPGTILVAVFKCDLFNSGIEAILKIKKQSWRNGRRHVADSQIRLSHLIPIDRMRLDHWDQRSGDKKS